jgi:hypothetical protein
MSLTGTGLPVRGPVSGTETQAALSDPGPARQSGPGRRGPPAARGPVSDGHRDGRPTLN